jgi:hypothetical protein
MPRIRSLRPNVTREEALEQFSPGGPSDMVRRLLFGPLHSVADFYIPFKLFQVDIDNAGARETRVFGLEAVSGTLDLYQFDSIPDVAQVIVRDTRNCVLPELEDERASQLLLDKVRRELFSRGFFRMRDLKIAASPVPGDLYIPYWVGFRGRGQRANPLVIDAVRRRFEGGKVRQLLENWLRGQL